ncbi:MAG: hypothetical protein ABI461_06590, partial [Polyangiaceae bacterium]
MSELTARARRVRIGSTEQRTRILSINVTPQGGQFLGRMAIVELDGSQSAREVDGKSCAEVVAGLALIGAFALDPEGLASDSNSVAVGGDKNDGARGAHP